MRTYQPNLPPPKFVFSGRTLISIVAAARWTASCVRAPLCRVAKSNAAFSVPNVRINSYAHIEDSIIYEGVDVGRHCQIRRAIIDKGIHIPAGARIGYDPDEDRRTALPSVRKELS